MKGIKLVLLSIMVTAMLTSCGTNNNNTTSTSSPQATQNDSGNVDKGNDGKVSDDVKDVGDDAGDAVKDVGDAAGDVVEGVGDAAGDVVEGAGDAVDANDANNNGR